MLAFAYTDQAAFVPLAFIILAVTVGSWGAVGSAAIAELYGTANLGAIRAVSSALMVFSSALAPGLMGVLLDNNITLDTQFAVSSLYCFALSGILFILKPHLNTVRSYAADVS